jgi:hypothetical protein
VGIAGDGVYGIAGNVRRLTRIQDFAMLAQSCEKQFAPSETLGARGRNVVIASMPPSLAKDFDFGEERPSMGVHAV